MSAADCEGIGRRLDFLDEFVDGSFTIIPHLIEEHAINELIDHLAGVHQIDRAGTRNLLRSSSQVRQLVCYCDEDNGPLRVIPESHLGGKMSSEMIQHWKQKETAVTCGVERGGVLVMRPLLLHASSPVARPRRRRVLHIDYAFESLPADLVWFDCV